jgi:hypothetical protein
MKEDYFRYLNTLKEKAQADEPQDVMSYPDERNNAEQTAQTNEDDAFYHGECARYREMITVHCEANGLKADNEALYLFPGRTLKYLNLDELRDLADSLNI